MSSDTTTEATAAIPPVAKDYADAFFDIEDKWIRLRKLAEVADYLGTQLCERCGDECKLTFLRNHPLPGAALTAVCELSSAVKEFDAAYYSAFNGLVTRENDANDPRRAAQ